MMAKHPEDDVEVEETTPPTTPTHSSITTPLCHTLQTPKPTKDAAADKSVQTSVEATSATDYQKLYIESLLSQIVMLKHTVIAQENQINKLIELVPKQHHDPAKHHAPAQQCAQETTKNSSSSSSSSSSPNTSLCMRVRTNESLRMGCHAEMYAKRATHQHHLFGTGHQRVGNDAPNIS